MSCQKIGLLCSNARSQWRFKTSEESVIHFLCHWSLCIWTRCVNVLLLKNSYRGQLWTKQMLLFSARSSGRTVNKVGHNVWFTGSLGTHGGGGGVSQTRVHVCCVPKHTCMCVMFTNTRACASRFDRILTTTESRSDQTTPSRDDRWNNLLR